MKKWIKNIFLCLIISTTFSYLPQALIAILNGVPLVSSINYSHIYISKGLPNDFTLIRFSKDIFTMILFFLMTIDIFIYKKVISKSIAYIYIGTIFLMSFSICSLLFSSEFSIYMVIAGFRINIFLITILIFLNNYFDEILIKKIYTIMEKVVFVEFVLVIFQAISCINYYGLVNIAKLRLIGTFASCGLLGLFGIGCLMFLLIYNEKYNGNKRYIFKIFEIGFLVFLSGTRVAMVCFLIIIFTQFYSKKINKINNKYLNVIFILLCVIISIFSLNIAENIADRGSAIEVQFEGGRVDFIYEYLDSASLKEILFGTGIGFGTNTALSMVKEKGSIISETKVMDGTLNILITQFGLIITCVIILGLVLLFWMIMYIKDVRFELKIAIISISVLLILIGNTLEQYNFQLFLAMTIAILFKKNYKGKILNE